MRPTEPTRIGVATSNAVWVLVRDIALLYVADNGPMRFHAQKLMAKVHVANARFVPCRSNTHLRTPWRASRVRG